MAALQFIEVPDYSAIIFRRTFADLALPGALMARAHEWFDGTPAKWDDKRHCLPPETEVLTRTGWKPIANICTGEYVASLDPATRFMSYQRVVHTCSHDYDGDLIEVHQRNGLAFACTPHHKVWHRTTSSKELRWCHAEDLPEHSYIPQWAHWEGAVPERVSFTSQRTSGKTVSFTAKDWASFLGWYLAEGCVVSKRGWIVLSQEGAQGRAEIMSLLDRNSIRWWSDPHNISFCNRALCDYLTPLGHAREKYIPDEVKQYAPELLAGLLDSYVQGDGHWDVPGQRASVGSVSRRLADDVCEVAIKAGFIATLRLDRPGPMGDRPTWKVHLRRAQRDTGVRRSRSERRVAYSGPVYCLSVPPYHTFFVRYHGRMSWTGNTWTFPSGATLAFGYLETERDKYRYQGAEFQYVGFDEVTQFSEPQFRYLFSRVRRPNTPGLGQVPLRMRGATNPGGIGHAWVQRRFIDPWSEWREGRAEHPVRSFHPARLEDLGGHLDVDQYELALSELDEVTYRQLRHGDWNIRPEGRMFDGAWFQTISKSEVPVGCNWVRYWDLAATEDRPGLNPDWTAGALLGRNPATGLWYLSDMKHFRKSPQETEQEVKRTAEEDGYGVRIYLEQEPGASGKLVVDVWARRVLPGFTVSGNRSTGSKVIRAEPLRSAAEKRQLRMAAGAWNDAFIREASLFPDGEFDDQVDALSGAHQMLAKRERAYDAVSPYSMTGASSWRGNP